MPLPRNLDRPVLDAVLGFAAETAYAPSSLVSARGRGPANVVFARWVIAGIVVEYYGATASCASEIAGVTPTRATELAALWRNKISDDDRGRILAAWEKRRKQAKLPTRKQIGFEAAS